MRKALGVYCYAGGFTHGIRQFFDVQAHLEDDPPYAAATAAHNLRVQIIPETRSEVHNWWEDGDDQRIEHLGSPLFGWRDDYDLIYGNPPCAAWSQAGVRGESWRTDPRVHCTTRHLSLVPRHRPKVWVWETINSTWQRGREFVDGVAQELMGMGYHVTAWLHNTRWFDCIQDRKRLFVIASNHAPFRPDYKYDQDLMDHGYRDEAAESLRRLNDRGEPYRGPENKHLYLWKDTPDGRKIVDTFDRLYLPDLYKDNNGKKFTGIGSYEGRPGFQLRRMPSTGPAPTVVVPFLHWAEERFLTENEMSHICGFPSSWEWCRGRKFTGSIVNEMARGVSPPMAAWLGEEIYDHLDGASSSEPPSYRVVDMLLSTRKETVLS